MAQLITGVIMLAVTMFHFDLVRINESKKMKFQRNHFFAMFKCIQESSLIAIPQDWNRYKTRFLNTLIEYISLFSTTNKCIATPKS